MSDDGYPTVSIEGKEIPYDPEQLRKVKEHPCYSKEACHKSGRMHLAVAPKCNIQCNYCVRDFDCVNESRPGVCSEVLQPKEAVDLVRYVLDKYPYIKVIGIAGPGDPLANEETFETLRLLKEEFPTPIKCLSTNGLLLPESIDRLLEYDVGNITVTMNAVDPEIGEKIYTFVEWEGKKLHGREAAEKLLSQQLKGIEMAVANKVLLKVNTVYIPGINDHHIVDVAKMAGEMGVFTFNLIPVIPQYKFSDITPPTPKEKKEMQDKCSPFVRQMRHCQRCRSDAIGLLGKDVQDCIYESRHAEE